MADAFDVRERGRRTQQRPGRVLVIAGWCGVGKTMLICGIIPELMALGVKVSTIKYAHDGFDLDHRDEDGFRHREAGAHEVLVISPRRWSLFHEMKLGKAESDVMAGVQKLSSPDLVLVEGSKCTGLPTIEVRRADVMKADMLIPPSNRVAIVTDDFNDDSFCPVISPSEPARLAKLIVSWMEKGAYGD